MLPLHFLFIFAFLCTRSFFKKSLKTVLLQLWESLKNSVRAFLEIQCILKQSIKNSVLVSAHCFKNELCFLCSVLVLTHRFKNDLRYMSTVLVSTHGFQNESCCMLGLPVST